MKRILTIFVAMLFVSFSFAQGSVKGKLMDGQSNEPLIGASVIVEGTTIGTISDYNGEFMLSNIEEGTQNLVISYLGYTTNTVAVTIGSGNTDLESITMEAGGVGLDVITVTGVVDFARERRTPVAVSTIKASEIIEKLGNQELPEMLNATPSVYATKSGGGFGDSRINIRGFDQKNTAVMINGVPVNDMENGWVYWSNWAGLSDVTTAMQVQRGLGSSKLAISSVGGTINVLTKTTDKKKGGAAAVMVGNDGYLKTMLTYSTGKMSNGFAVSALMSRTSGNGYVQGTEFTGYNYFLGMGYEKGNSNFQFTVTGAPQTHNQRTTSFYNMAKLSDYRKHGNKYNYNHGTLDGNEFNWRKNFYHKPIASLNWDLKLNEKSKISTVAYASVGRGGGTGDIGRAPGYGFASSSRFRDADGAVDWDRLVKYNSGEEVTFYDDKSYQIAPNDDGKYIISNRDNGIVRRASMNSHNWFGVISNFNHKLSDALTFDVGIDVRKYKGIHYRRLDNLLGADGYVDNDDVNNPDNVVTETSSSDLADLWNVFKSTDDDVKIDYHNDGLVNWVGAFTQLEYSKNGLSAFVQAAVSNQGYKRIDYFSYTNDDTARETEYENILGGNIKGGANYNINDNHNVFANAGYYSKQPLFDAVWINYKNDLNEDHENEGILGMELGYGYISESFRANVNMYRTSWTNRFITVSAEVDNVEGSANLYGVEQVHMGLEIDAEYKMNDMLRVNGMMSFGDWQYKGDVTGDLFDDELNKIGTSTLYLDGVRVGDAAQFTSRLGVSVMPVKGFYIDASIRSASNLYAKINAEDFDHEDHKGSLKLPSYSLIDAGVSYKLDLPANQSLTFRVNINNVADTEYLSESATNYHAEDGDETYLGINTGNKVFFGFGRTWNTSVRYNF